MYIAKLAVLISIPKTYTTHCPWSLDPFEVGGKPGGGWEELEGHGEILSESKTPFSRASCSRVMGIKDPIETVLADLLRDIL